MTSCISIFQFDSVGGHTNWVFTDSKGIFSLDYIGDLGKEVSSLCTFIRDRCVRAWCSLFFLRKGAPVKKIGTRGCVCLRDRCAKGRVTKKLGFFCLFWFFSLYWWLPMFLGRLVWRERDWLEIWTALTADVGVRRQLAAWGLLNFAKNEFLRSQDRLLRYIIQHWCRRCNMFILRGKNLIIRSETDIYFVTRLLPQC